MVEALDQVRMTLFSFFRLSSRTLASNFGQTYGPFFLERTMIAPSFPNASFRRPVKYPNLSQQLRTNIWTFLAGTPHDRPLLPRRLYPTLNYQLIRRCLAHPCPVALSRLTPRRHSARQPDGRFAFATAMGV